jgi:hypothetical protein
VDKLNHRVQIFDKKWILAQSNKNLILTRSDLKARSDGLPLPVFVVHAARTALPSRR